MYLITVTDRLELFGVLVTRPAAKRSRNYRSIGHFLNLAVLPAHSRNPDGSSDHPAAELFDAAFRRFSMCRPAEPGPPQDG
jgi:hypothetical protein